MTLEWLLSHFTSEESDNTRKLDTQAVPLDSPHSTLNPKHCCLQTVPKFCFHSPLSSFLLGKKDN
jgi:hypothetical protein